MPVSNDSQTAAESIVTIDRRRGDRRKGNSDSPAKGATNPPRPRKARRRHIDPTTCERDYSGDEIEFMRAMDDYKRDAGRMFPTCSEVLEVIRNLGYYKLSDEQAAQLGLQTTEIPGDEANNPEASEEDFTDE